MESLVIVDQHATVNLYLSLVLTARNTLEVEWIGRILHFIINFGGKICIKSIEPIFGFDSESTMICLVTGVKS